jgi:CheY-like chemotaxis protein
MRKEGNVMLSIVEMTDRKVRNVDFKNLKMNDEIRFKHVLIVEDNEINIKVIKILLSECGIKNITVAQNGKEALERITDEYDLVILDMGLPDMNGLEVFERMKSILKGTYTRIIACTANDDWHDKCLEAGMDGFMTKPVMLPELKKMLEKTLLA